MKNNNTILAVLLTMIIGLILVTSSYYDNKSKDKTKVTSLYQVYLNGNKIGLIEDKDKLYNLIDEEQNEIKEKYEVKNVYPPNNLEIVKVNTYNENVSDINKIYQEIEQRESFTVKGYIVTITGTKNKNKNDSEMVEEGTKEEEVSYTINVLDKQIFENAIHNFINVFISEKDYNDFLNNTQPEIVDVGKIIEAMYFSENITIKEGYISTNEKIYTDEGELTQYLLYGDSPKDKKYTVQKGDTISEIAENNQLNVEEFLIANPKFKSADSLLAIGETVSVALIDPVISLNYEMHVVEDVEQVYEKETVYDRTKPYGYSEVTQKGVTGLTRVTQKTKMTNGESSQVSVIINQEVLREKVNEITTKGNMYSGGWNGDTSSITGTYVDTGQSWGWPTNSPYVITSPFAWRWGKLHEGIDISGTGHGSPIYAAGEGTVLQCAMGTGYQWANGNYAIIEHANNIYTIYAHMSALNCSVGQHVSKGQMIGRMGATGYAFGTHLHFGVSVGYPGRGKYINPNSLY